MILQDPIWLLLIVPFAVLLWLVKLPSRLLQGLRIAVVVLLILALCRPAILLPSYHGTVVIVADRSASMPADKDLRHEEIARLVQDKMDTQDDLAIVSFGDQPVIEPLNSDVFQGFTSQVNPDGSNLADAINTAMSLIPPEKPGRVLVLTDGRWTGLAPAAVTTTAMSRQIPIDYRFLERPGAMDLAISEIQSPATVNPQESYMINAWVTSPVSQEIAYELRRGNTVISQGRRQVPAGRSRLTFRDRAAEPGTLEYTVSVKADAEDPVMENNAARALVGVRGPKPIVCLTAEADSGLGQLLTNSGVNVRVLTPQQMEYSLERLSNYQGLIIEDLPANDIGTANMNNIAEWVTKTGAGLMMTGGKNAYGPGGYFKSPLEPIMPVSMELRREHRKLSLAIVVALDRSGSMGAPVGLGKTKMDLANLATAEVLNLLSPMDQFGVLAVDSSAHLILDMTDVSEASAHRNKILQIESMGGGIFVYEALSHAAKMVADAEPQTKHIILFSDAADSEQPGAYKELLAECAKSGITVSVIGLGKPTDIDAALLEDVARLGQGRCFFTESATELPRLFAQDTFVVARSSFLEDVTSVDGLPSMLSILGRQYDIAHTVGGYNLCYLREGATQCAVTIDEYQAPVMAAWQSGIGRALCYTPQADGPFTGDLVSWSQIGEFFASMANWVAGRQGELGEDMVLTQQVQNGLCRIELHLDPQRDTQHVLKLPTITSLSGYTAQSPDTQNFQMTYVDADTLAAEFSLQGARTYLSTVEIDGFNPVTLPPVTLPYSPEFKPVDRQRSVDALASIADATGGDERIDVSGIWDDLPAKRQLISLVPWLIVVAAVLFLLEVFQRRTGLLAHLKWDVGIAKKAKGAAVEKAVRPKKKKTKSAAAKTTEPKSDAKPAPEPKAKK
ncbi:MAG: vWA domain-containing protein, partial [Planctomycetota bacterium]